MPTDFWKKTTASAAHPGKIPSQFIPGERRFVGTAPANVTQIQVQMVARDERGEQVTTTIVLNFDR